MQNRLKDKVGTYSLGMKQRLGLAQALIHKPKLLILDETTNGMDPAGINEFRNIIKNLAKAERLAVLVSSHLISEVELMCDKVVIINNGELIKYSSVAEITKTQEVFWVLDDIKKGLELIKANFNIDGVIRNERLEAAIDMKLLPEINLSFMRSGLILRFVDNKHRTLEDLFLDLTGGETIIR
jgi:ABC-2 type transport system ATP-binding protein